MRKKRSPFGALCLLLVLAALVCAGVLAWKRYMPTNERADLSELYDGKQNKITLFLNYEKQDTKGLYEDGQAYLPLDWVNQKLNERFYWDTNEKILVYALPEEIVYADLTSTGATGKKMVLEKEDGVYLALGLVLNYTDIRLQTYDSGNWKRIYVENDWEPIAVADLKTNGRLRIKGGVKSPVITDALKGETVTVLETMEKWSKVMTRDGHIGYMYNWKLENLREEKPESTFQAPVYKNISLDEKISLVWHQVTLDAANDSMEELLASTKGVNVIAPTWYTLSDNQGAYESFASKSYVDKAHEKGLQVWAVIDNFSRECSKNVKSEILLSRTSVRRKLIANLIEEAQTYGFDGINLDFESLKEEAGVHYIQFIRELSVSCRREGLVLSVDNYVPAPYNKFYNRKEQGIVADYVIIMGYDEHYAGGEPGPVASVGYVEQGIKDTLESVPKEKVINGVPFYTRLWTTAGDNTTSKAMGIYIAKQWIEDNNVEMLWKEDLGQSYGEINTEEGRSALWMEDSRSLGLKMDVIKKYDLAGVGGWKLGLETRDVWDVINWGEGAAASSPEP